MKLTVFTADGSSSTEKDFPHFPEFDGEKGVAALRQVLIAQQANKRQGNASTKTRAEVSGTGKKLFRQKGSGTARQDSSLHHELLVCDPSNGYVLLYQDSVLHAHGFQLHRSLLGILNLNNEFRQTGV